MITIEKSTTKKSLTHFLSHTKAPKVYITANGAMQNNKVPIKAIKGSNKSKVVMM